MSLYVLELYREGDRWVFDDPRFALKAEPFWNGASALIDALTNAWRGRLLATFSSEWFVGYEPKASHCTMLTWVRSGGSLAGSGETYRALTGKAAGMEAWFCPAFYHYFPIPPATLRVRALRLEVR